MLETFRFWSVFHTHTNIAERTYSLLWKMGWIVSQLVGGVTGHQQVSFNKLIECLISVKFHQIQCQMLVISKAPFVFSNHGPPTHMQYSVKEKRKREREDGKRNWNHSHTKGKRGSTQHSHILPTYILYCTYVYGLLVTFAGWMVHRKGFPRGSKVKRKEKKEKKDLSEWVCEWPPAHKIDSASSHTSTKLCDHNNAKMKKNR